MFKVFSNNETEVILIHGPQHFSESISRLILIVSLQVIMFSGNIHQCKSNSTRVITWLYHYLSLFFSKHRDLKIHSISRKHALFLSNLGRCKRYKEPEKNGNVDSLQRAVQSSPPSWSSYAFRIKFSNCQRKIKKELLVCR